MARSQHTTARAARRPALLAGLVVALVLAGLGPADAASRRVSLTVAPTTPLVGASVSVSGTVTSTPRRTKVVLQRWSGRRWLSLSTVRTGTRGRFTARTAAASPGRWSYRVRVPAAGKRKAVTSGVRRVDVLRGSSVSLSVERRSAAWTFVQVRGLVRNARTGAPVRLERRVAGAWRRAADGRVGAGSRYDVGLELPVGTSSVRVVAPRDAYRAAAVSPTVTVTVAPPPATGSSATPTPPAQPAAEPSRTVSGTITGQVTWAAGSTVVLTGPVDVAAGATLTVEDGVAVRSAGHALTVHGTLRAGRSGTTTFTSTSTAPRAGDWPGIRVARRGHADLGRSHVSGADTALRVVRGGSAQWRGSVAASAAGLDSDGFADARHVDWGSPTGPAAFGTGAAVRGYGALVVPWQGFTPATGSTWLAEDAPQVPCVDVVLVGARGSGEAPQGSDAYEDAAFGGTGVPTFGVLHGAYSTVQEARPGTSFTVVPVRYAAAGYPPADDSVDWPTFSASLRGGADAVAALTADVARRCPDSLVVLVGASQGAAAVRAGLVQADGAGRDAVAAVGLLADPSTVPDATETIWSTSWTARSVPKVGGVVPMSSFARAATSDLPDDVAARTLALCHEGDAVCDAGPDASIERHADYSAQETLDLGAALGRLVLDRLGDR
ncbi:hypothetical protein GCM10008944_24690 [Cytobacillus oceanisediminis]